MRSEILELILLYRGHHEVVGWFLSVDDLYSSPFFSGVVHKDEYLQEYLSNITASDINHVHSYYSSADNIPINHSHNILNDGCLLDLIEYVAPATDAPDSHIVFWPTQYAKTELFKVSIGELESRIYDKSDFVMKEQSSYPFYGVFNRMDKNGVVIRRGVLIKKNEHLKKYIGAAPPAISAPLRAWITHIGLLDHSRMAKLRPYAARYWR